MSALQDILQQMDRIRQLPSFDASHYPLDQLVQDIKSAKEQQQLSTTDVGTINSHYGADYLKQTIGGQSLAKPYGYAGDFEVIDCIYQYYTATTTPFFTFLDEYCHQQSASIAVRNRKDYFKQLLLDECAQHDSSSPLRLLNAASGPARDLAELYVLLPQPQQLHTTCLDMDPHAIAYAQQLIDDDWPVHFFHKISSAIRLISPTTSLGRPASSTTSTTEVSGSYFNVSAPG